MQLYICGYTNKLAGRSCTFQQYSQVKQGQTLVFTLDIYKTYLAKLLHPHDREVQTLPRVTPQILRAQLLRWC